MTIKTAMSTIGRKASELGDAVLDGAIAGIDQIEGRTDVLAKKAGQKLYSKTGDWMMNESIQGIKGKAVRSANANAFKVGNAVGGGAEGLLVGAAGGAVVGGVTGGIDSDETFLGGMGKGALAGAGLGFAAGSTSALLHNNAGLLDNVFNDSEAVAARISKWRVGMGDGISNVRTSARERWNQSIFNPKNSGVL